ncbi:hypothetical protein [uncultured Streptomyces sp.]|uniref:hypothetical protein n=1 Tax=uncultured Streptomyces sp. TaxID=174707 RepID=UPI00260CB3FE|nr:hypothetical protein [uncultured Streptomyces sp.]
MTIPPPAPTAPASAPEPGPGTAAWVPAAVAAIGVVLTLTVCAVVGFAFHEYPALREPASGAFAVVTGLGMVTTIVISVTRRR